MESSSILFIRWTPSFPAQASKLSLNGCHENGNAPGKECEKKHFGGKSDFFLSKIVHGALQQNSAKPFDMTIKKNV